jgi:hypothetical protein
MSIPIVLIGVVTRAIINASSKGTASDVTTPTEIPLDLLEFGGQRETSRYSEPIGEDVGLLDNSRSDVEYVRTYRVNKSIERQFKIDQESTSKLATSASAGVKASVATASVALQAEKLYKETLSELHLERHIVEQTIEFKMPPRTSLEITLKWKRIWQRGEITLRSKSGDQYFIPYQETQGLDYDIETVTSARR